ncbi:MULTISPECIES: FeoA family protein [Terrabacteria group]|uniref:FeoA family protein n=1 Tax=Bacillati TaxID=1783272 RepID=UPI001C6ECF02|nr:MULTISPECIES: FeoA family protein [Terrabacteria group]MBW9211988.1 ferrous iron transport protein A [Trueperella sp. zg.1013]
MPLIFGDIAQIYTIKKIGGDAHTRKHLQDLGFTQGTNVQIISKNSGNLIVKVKETRVALGASMAAKILI